MGKDERPRMKEGLGSQNRSGSRTLEVRVGQGRCWFQSWVSFDLTVLKIGSKGSQEGKPSLQVEDYGAGILHPGLPMSKPPILSPGPAQW